jgi:pimeloyl-ACP methyl ester carboxylesterase
MVLVASGGLGREVSMALRAATLPGAELVLPLIINRHVHHVGLSASRLLGRLPVRLRPSVVEAARGYASLAESPARSAFVSTLRSVVGPTGQRVCATDRLYLAEGRPILIVWGAGDTVIPVAHGRAAHVAIPGSKLEIFEVSGHFPHQDEPTRFAKVLVDFLQTTKPAVLDRATLRELLTNRARSVPLHEAEPTTAEGVSPGRSRSARSGGQRRT